jgi:hypothetical protein
MDQLVIASQIVVAVSVLFVWVFRFENIVTEFKHYGLPDLVRSMVGASKIAMATLLLAGIWFPPLVFYPALVMTFLMICAQYFHFKVKNPWSKHAPSLVLLILSLVIVLFHAGMIR